MHYKKKCYGTHTHMKIRVNVESFYWQIRDEITNQSLLLVSNKHELMEPVFSKTNKMIC